MPLTTAQQGIIEASIAHLLDISTDADGLTQYSTQLQVAFSSATPPEDPNMRTLHQCLFQPEQTIVNLEKTNKAITVREVQTFILDYIERRLAESPAAAAATYKLAKATLLAGLPADHAFVTPTPRVPEHIAPTEALTVLNTNGHLFDAHFKLDYNFRQITLTVTPHLTPAVPAVTKTLDVDELLEKHQEIDFSDINTQDLGLLVISGPFMELVQREALQMAANPLLQRLKEEKVLTERDIRNASIGSKDLISHPHYFNAARAKQIHFIRSLTISRSLAKLLITPAALALLARDMPISEIIAITSRGYEFDLLQHPFYGNAYRCGQLNLLSIKGLDKRGYYRLTNPIVTALIGLEKLTITSALSLSGHALHLLNEQPAYYEAVKKGELTLEDLAKLPVAEEKTVTTYSKRLLAIQLQKPEKTARGEDSLDILLTDINSTTSLYHMADDQLLLNTLKHFLLQLNEHIKKTYDVTQKLTPTAIVRSIHELIEKDGELISFLAENVQLRAWRNTFNKVIARAEEHLKQATQTSEALPPATKRARISFRLYQPKPGIEDPRSITAFCEGLVGLRAMGRLERPVRLGM